MGFKGQGVLSLGCFVGEQNQRGFASREPPRALESSSTCFGAEGAAPFLPFRLFFSSSFCCASPSIAFKVMKPIDHIINRY